MTTPTPPVVDAYIAALPSDRHQYFNLVHRISVLVATLAAVGCGSQSGQTSAAQGGSAPTVHTSTESAPDPARDFAVVPDAMEALPPSAGATDFIAAVRSDSSCADVEGAEFEPTDAWLGRVERWIRFEGVIRQIPDEELPSDVVLGAKVPLDVEISDPLSGDRSQISIGVHRDYMPMLDHAIGIDGLRVIIGVASYGSPYNVAHVALAVSETDVAFGGHCATESLTTWFDSRFDGQATDHLDEMLALTGDSLQDFLGVDQAIPVVSTAAR